MLIDKNLRAILTNSRRGPEALVLQVDPDSAPKSPTAPWTGFSVSTYMDVTYPTQTTGQYEFAIREFFRVHPLLEVKAFDRHKRFFPFPATHCTDREDDGDREDGARPHGGATANGNGSPSPRKGQETPVPGDSGAAGWSAGRLSAKRIVIAAGGVLLALGVLAAAWFRRRRSAE
ncbi:hypothetical protein [Streptomyces tropicalis]|uniref:Uncharacterized protein n=1 Tax=Streptomyces tropicalis TaxID=3034234 RepID=A0ABT5ZYM9_9ACTN|nr:hypothetical protein [Streptomyces tropicalis]MDF3297494.1 hypothetical protein [Streptomyces tropicalis]